MKLKMGNKTLLLCGAASALVLFVIADLAISFILPNSTPLPRDPQSSMFEHFDAGWYELKKNFSTNIRWGGKAFQINTDQYGFRVDPKNQKNGKGKYIFLGDSFTFGSNGPLDETFVGMFDAATTEKVINSGVPSYSPSAYLHQYKKALELNLLEREHTVIAVLDLSDVQDEASFWSDGVNHPLKLSESLAHRDNLGERAPSTLALRFKLSFTLLRLIRRFALNYLFAPDEVLDRRRSAFTWDNWKELDSTPAWINGGYGPLGVAGGLERIHQKIVSIADLAHKNSSKLYLLIYPWPGQLTHTDNFSWSDYVSKLCNFVQCAGVIDACGDFRDYAATHRSWYSDLYVNGDIHFNQAGNKLIFENIMRALNS